MKRFQPLAPCGPPGDLPPGRTWAGFMRLALAQAKQAARAGEIPVGAVIITKSGQIVAAAANKIESSRNPCGHAEILAIRSACKRLDSVRLSNHILVVTLEPCLMCAGAIAQSRLDGVVFGACDSQAGAIVSIADKPNLPLAGAPFWHLGGIEAEQCATILSNFFKQRRSGGQNA